MKQAKARDVDWRSGKTNFYVQFGGDDVLEVARQAADLFFSENAHGVAAFPSVERLQTDVVAWLLDLVEAGPMADGCLTASGSESILFCLKAARDWSRTRRPDLAIPKVVVPRSAHPAFDKAGGLLGIEVVRTPLRADLRADVEAMRRQICARTILVAGSAPQFGHGVVDPIPEIAALAIETNLWVHVDACVGALFAPFARAAGATIPPFDFSIDGVRSISADIHKYGFGAKGASAALFRHSCWRPSYVFTFDDWPIGSYASSGLAGTRSAAPIAAAWAVMRYLGHDGYVRIARQILEAFGRLRDGLEAIEGIEVVGDPDLPVLAWRSADAPLDAIVSAMTRRGWFVRTMTTPRAVHMGMITLHQAPVVDAYLESLRESVAESRAR
ncbi:aspartate aminotransferase family protein [Starkeya sp. ORNL1]|uniref:pyridoxal phosphate-dependent decarboxylase family protein n=1 Tax=Starkeya sp. ORNL1 TaxID=2709380 RepID=UPI001462C833|nr:aminotransferase class V-fold PLP-dependent enzyme [Starkeya sp. ORNL1]QJP14804.1 aspartate aminotransferase family protein [Starkeya sp. ORNL1]